MTFTIQNIRYCRFLVTFLGLDAELDKAVSVGLDLFSDYSDLIEAFLYILVLGQQVL